LETKSYCNKGSSIESTEQIIAHRLAVPRAGVASVLASRWLLVSPPLYGVSTAGVGSGSIIRVSPLSLILLELDGGLGS
jgi:hypothetical protein